MNIWYMGYTVGIVRFVYIDCNIVDIAHIASIVYIVHHKVDSVRTRSVDTAYIVTQCVQMYSVPMYDVYDVHHVTENTKSVRQIRQR